MKNGTTKVYLQVAKKQGAPKNSSPAATIEECTWARPLGKGNLGRKALLPQPPTWRGIGPTRARTFEKGLRGGFWEQTEFHVNSWKQKKSLYCRATRALLNGNATVVERKKRREQNPRKKISAENREKRKRNSRKTFPCRWGKKRKTLMVRGNESSEASGQNGDKSPETTAWANFRAV